MKAKDLREGHHYRTTEHGVVQFVGYDLHGFAVCRDERDARHALTLKELVEPAPAPAPARLETQPCQ